MEKNNEHKPADDHKKHDKLNEHKEHHKSDEHKKHEKLNPHKEHHKSDTHKKHHESVHKKPHKPKKSFSNSFYTNIYFAFGIALIIFIGYNITQGTTIAEVYDQALAEAKEAAKPSAIELVTITNDACTDCFDVTAMIDSLKKANVEVKKETNLDISSSDAKELINKYNIEKVPTFIVLGEIDKLNVRDLEKREDALIFTQVTPPYTDAATSKILGRVSLTLLQDSSCEKCIDLSPITSMLKESGVHIVSETTVERNMDYGSELIDTYSLTVLPALIVSKDLADYDAEITSWWEYFGTVEADGSYVTRIVSPPYLNLTTNKVEGLVTMTVLTDKSCENCYNPNEFHKPILQRMGVVFGDEISIDVSDSAGKSLIQKYSIKKVPTIIISGDVEKYPSLVEAWNEVGTVESDGAYVFREVEVTGQTYIDLDSGQIIDPTASN